MKHRKNGFAVPARILLPVDESVQSFRAVEYCAQLLENLRAPERMHIKLLLVECLPDFTAYDDPAVWEEECKVVVAEFRDALEKARDILVASGADPEMLEAGYVVQKQCEQMESADMRNSIARCIVQEQQDGRFDTLIMGRRSQSKAQAYLSGSVTRRVLDTVKDCTVWLVC